MNTRARQEAGGRHEQRDVADYATHIHVLGVREMGDRPIDFLRARCVESRPTDPPRLSECGTIGQRPVVVGYAVSKES